MKYKSCKFLEQGINFGRGYVTTCSVVLRGCLLFDFNLDSEFNFKKIQEKREQLIDSAKKGNLPECCDDCCMAEEKEWGNNSQINNIEIDHWTHCNCKCIYCSNNLIEKKDYTEKAKNSKHYNVYPLLKEMFQQGIIEEQYRLGFTGGEAGVLKEFKEIMKLALKTKCSHIDILSSCVEYVPIIGEALKKGNTYLTSSLDCGCRETFKKIKQIDAFDKYIKNLKKYIKDSKDNTDKIFLKYILLENINDNKDEIDKFIDIASKIGVKKIIYAPEYCLGLVHKKGQKIPEHTYEIIEYMKEKATEKNITCSTIDFITDLLKRGYY